METYKCSKNDTCDKICTTEQFDHNIKTGKSSTNQIPSAQTKPSLHDYTLRNARLFVTLVVIASPLLGGLGSKFSNQFLQLVSQLKGEFRLRKQKKSLNTIDLTFVCRAVDVS